MDFLPESKSVSEIVHYTISHPNKELGLTLSRKPFGARYVTCNPCNAPSFTISEQEFNEAMNAIDTWIHSKYEELDPTNSWGLTISGGEPGKRHRLTLVFSLNNNLPSVDLRFWRRPHMMKGVFTPTETGFTIKGDKNISVLMEMREMFQVRGEKIDKLEKNINLAHDLIFEMYETKCGKPYNNQLNPFEEIIDVEDFVLKWNHHTKNIPGFECDVTPIALCSYLLKFGKGSVEHHIKCRQFEDMQNKGT